MIGLALKKACVQGYGQNKEAPLSGMPPVMNP